MRLAREAKEAGGDCLVVVGVDVHCVTAGDLGSDDAFDVNTGSPVPIASATGKPKPSVCDGWQRQSAPHISARVISLGRDPRGVGSARAPQAEFGGERAVRTAATMRCTSTR